jgi:hypothetical protein
MMAEQLSTPKTEATPAPEAPSPANADQARKSQRQQRLVLGGAIVLVVLILAALIGGSYAAYQNPDGARVTRDIAIIVLAALSIVIGVLMILLLYQVTMLTLMMRDEIKPLLESINETMNTVRGTAVFMSDNVVQPTINVASTLAGVRRAFESLAGIRSSVQPKQRKE